MKLLKAVITLTIITLSITTSVKAEEATPQADALAKGKELTFNRRKGNCLACHMIDDGPLAGNVAPPLIAMKARFPDRAVLREQIWDATIRNPLSVMPPFGKHGILTEQEVDLVVDYVHSL
ncbi:MAG: sulfur oxidation c-type cytochrome SoxX [Kangiellaceae bacterium]|jgi:sulfur-oxidizing protein SoxX|nr:sulfur oxidation c-type cytochrome SoxX [Kangiellaceae bacterium]